MTLSAVSALNQPLLQRRIIKRIDINLWFDIQAERPPEVLFKKVKSESSDQPRIGPRFNQRSGIKVGTRICTSQHCPSCFQEPSQQF